MMSKIDWKRKLSSRKLWAAIAGVVTGLAMVFKLEESTISSAAGAVVLMASVVSLLLWRAKWMRRAPKRPWVIRRIEAENQKRLV